MLIFQLVTIILDKLQAIFCISLSIKVVSILVLTSESCVKGSCRSPVLNEEWMKPGLWFKFNVLAFRGPIYKLS